MIRALLGVVLLCSAAPLAADHDFLTNAEIEQVRLAQAPNARLQLYLDFARQRLDQVKQMAKDTRPGRAAIMQIALFEPDIPQNTGTILRLAACLGVEAHLIEPAGFPTSPL